MIPEIITLKKYPTTPNGKIDVNSLPLPKTEKKELIHRTPKNNLENDILEICKEILSIDDFYVDSDFFKDGFADSLTILTISSRLFTKGLKIPTQYFYNYSTIETLVDNLDPIFEDNLNEATLPILKYQTNPNNYNYDNLKFNYSKILLTGSTGFLGIHILYYLLQNTNSNIICIVRRKNKSESPYDRLKRVFKTYFSNTSINLFEKRVKVVEGDLSNETFNLSDNDYSLIKKCDCVIHTAAITKHYGDFKLFYDSNILGTKHIANFCLENNIILNYMSTTSIVGNETNNNDNSVLTENDFYIGQNYTNNVYVHSKFKAEEIIYKEQYNGLNANVFRLGNLMGRYSDGVFQTNKYDNAFYTKLLTMCKLQKIPYSLNNIQFDFSPIDVVSDCIIKLLSIPNLTNCIFHIFNNNIINTDTLLNFFNNNGISLNYTSDNDFISSLSNDENLMKFFISDLSDNNFLNMSESIKIDSKITNEFLKRLNFNWPTIDDNYLSKFIDKTNFYNDLQKTE